MKNTLETLVIPSCVCGVALTTTQERTDGLCTPCADGPACTDVHPTVMVTYATAKVRAEVSNGIYAAN